MTIDLNRQYGFDKKMADDGVKMVIGPNKDEDYVLVRKSFNREYRAKLTESNTKYSDMLESLRAGDPKAADDLDDKLMCEIIAETIFIGVGPGIEVNGKPFKDTVENRTELLLELPDLRSSIMVFAAERKNFQPDPNPAKLGKK